MIHFLALVVVCVWLFARSLGMEMVAGDRTLMGHLAARQLQRPIIAALTTSIPSPLAVWSLPMDHVDVAVWWVLWWPSVASDHRCTRLL